MNTLLVWMLIAGSDYSYKTPAHVTVVGHFETVQQCQHVERNVREVAPMMTIRCIQAKVVVMK